MALSGTFYSNVNSRWRLQLEWSATQNITANTSTITAKLYWVGLDGYSAISSSATKDGAIIIDGTTYTFSGAGLAGLSAGQKKLLATKSKTVTHNADGSRSFAIDGYFDAEITIGGSYVSRANLTGQTYSLNTIPRKSTVSSAISFTVGEDFNISVAKASSSFRHSAYIDVLDSNGTDWVFIKYVEMSSSQSSVSTNFTEAEKKTIMQCLGSLSSVKVRINLHTYNGSSTLGYTTKEGIVKSPVPSTLSSSMSGFAWIDETITLDIARESSELSHTVKLIAGGVLIKSFTSVTSKISFTLTDSEKNLIYSQIPNSTYVNANVEIYTFYQGLQARGKTDNPIQLVAQNVEPEFSGTGVGYIDSNSVSVSLTGDATKIVQNTSTVQVKIPASSRAIAKAGASITNYIITLAGKQIDVAYTNTDIAINFGTINTTVDQTLTVEAIDTRGLSRRVNIPVTMIPYTQPVLTASAKRLNGFDNNTKFMANGSFSAVTINGVQKNKVSSVKYRYRKVSEATTVSSWVNWTSFSVTNSGTSYMTTAMFRELDNASSWLVEFQVTDKLTSRNYSTTVGQGKPILFIDAIKKTVGIGKFSTSYMLDVAGDINVDGKANINGGLDVGGKANLNGGISTNGNIEGNWWNLTNVWDALFFTLNTMGNATIGGTLSVSGNDIRLGDHTRILSDVGTSKTYIQSGLSGSDTNAEVILSRYMTINSNLNKFVVNANTVEITGMIDNENYILASLANGWSNYSGTTGYQRASYWKDKNGVVHLTGLIKGGTATNNTVLLTLPAGYRPANQHAFVCLTSVSASGGTKYARIDVATNGQVIGGNYLDNGWTSLAGISFKAEK